MLPISFPIGEDESSSNEQKTKLGELEQSLLSYGVHMKVEYSDTLHDREIIFSSGWIIKIGRGLDYFKAPKGRTSIGFCDFDLRECSETTIDVYNSE